ncbi:MAG: hypothetical protein IJ415_00350 [Clostridia bacterium]|nr:hypothetical protein [Clostridia bacterium]
MATKRTVSKTSHKATVDFDWDVGSNKKTSKRSKKKAQKQIKKLGAGVIITAVLLLIVGVVGGYFGVKVMTKDDCFTLIGKDELTLTLDETYTDEGVKVIAFGKDDSDKVEIETNLKKNEDGTYYAEEAATYYITYTVNDFKYGTLFKIQKIRLITFVEESETDEKNSAIEQEGTQEEVVNE